jgi:hypothetical protein
MKKIIIDVFSAISKTLRGFALSVARFKKLTSGELTTIYSEIYVSYCSLIIHCTCLAVSIIFRKTIYVNFTYFYVPVLIAVLLTVTASLLVKFNRFYPYLLFYSLKKNKT